MPPKCIICGASIPRPKKANGNFQPIIEWNKRKLCDKLTDDKENPCWKVSATINGHTAKGVPKHMKESDRRVKLAGKEMIDEQLDLEQMRINIEIDRRRWQHCGYVTAPGRSLSPAEIEAIAHTLSPPSKQEKIIYPVYQNLPLRNPRYMSLDYNK